MTTKLRARFDGNVLVPIGPVDLPRGEILSVEVKPALDLARGSPELILQILKELPPVDSQAVDEWERAIEEGKLPPTDTGAFDDLR